MFGVTPEKYQNILTFRVKKITIPILCVARNLFTILLSKKICSFNEVILNGFKKIEKIVFRLSYMKLIRLHYNRPFSFPP